MSTNVHGHRVWMKNSHVSEKVVTTRTHIVRSSYAVMRRDTVVARKISAACSLFLCRNGTIRRVCQALSAEILVQCRNSSALARSNSWKPHPPNIIMTSCINIGGIKFGGSLTNSPIRQIKFPAKFSGHTVIHIQMLLIFSISVKSYCQKHTFCICISLLQV